MNKKQDEVEEGAADWVVSYGDMMSLLLTFFILLFSFSSIDAQKWQELVASLRGDPMIVELDTSDNKSVIDILPDESAGEPPSEEPGEKDDEFPGDATPAPTGLNGADERAVFDHLYAQILDTTREAGVESRLEVLRTETEIILRFYNNLMFDSGKANLNARSMEVIAAITPLLMQYEAQIRKIRIEGNTDDVPIHNSRFRDNYELSMQRALVVLRYILDAADFPPEKLVAIGYGEYYPIAGNDTEEGRAQNRRTDIILVGYAPADGPS